MGKELLSEHVVQALCRTLVHSIWQGLILAVLTGLIMLLTKRSSSAARYRLLTGLLCCFTLAFTFTLIIELSNPAGAVSAVSGNLNHPINLSDLLNYTLIYIQDHAGIVVFAWLVVICLRSIRLMFGLYALERLRRIKTGRLSLQWENRLTLLAQNLGIKQAVSLLESGVVKVPLIIGYLKPVILVPIGLVNALEPKEVEAILLHELAHIRRRDYLVNLLQSLVETLFFFNPAVRWLSSLIRAEREHCCDDIVLGQTQNKLGYIKALVHFQEHQLTAPGYALAFGGKNGGMVQRLERIVADHNRSLSKLEMIGLAILLAVSSLFIAAKPGNSSELISKTNKTAPLSPELRNYLHNKELAARKRFLERKEAAGTATKSEALELLRYTGETMSPELRKYYQEKERATGRRLRAEEAARQRARSKDSIP